MRLIVIENLFIRVELNGHMCILES